MNWILVECDLINEENINETNRIVPIFPKFKKPSYNKISQQSKLSNGLNLKQFEDNASISTKKSSILSCQNTITYNYIVNHFLNQLKEHIGKDSRQEIESQIIRNLISQKSKQIYMLNIKWASNYTNFLSKQNNICPEQINNYNLINDDGIKQGLKQDIDYVLMNRNTWLFIQCLYGGGPELLFIDQNQTESQVISRSESTQQIELNFKDYIIQPIGFYNEYNYCFMHAALQSLFSIEPLNCWMSNEGKKKKTQWVKSYIQIIEQINSCKKGQYIKINEMKQYIKTKFPPNQQHDCQEFLCYLTEQLNYELKQDKFDQSITEILFQGQMISLINCQNCNGKSSKIESFFELSLSMNKLKKLSDCIQYFFAQEILNDIYQCEICHQTTKAIKKYIIGTPPQYLCIHLKRFQEQKLHYFVEFPILLDLTNYCQKNTQYKLKSLIVHYGTQEKGHYVNFSLRGNHPQQQWYYFDDHRVSQIKESDVLKQQAYILFYELIEQQQQQQQQQLLL